MKFLICLLSGIMFNFLGFSSIGLAHDDLNFEYICSVTQKNRDGLFRDVVNVVFLPDWQKKSHIYRDETKDIWFEVAPVKNSMGEIESYQMELKLYLQKAATPSLSFHGPEFSEIGFEHFDLNIGAHCFHRSQRGK
jgi:hypothetical protein